MIVDEFKMPSHDRFCRHCGRLVTNNNMARHISRHHPNLRQASGVSTPSSSAAQSRSSSTERGPTVADEAGLPTTTTPTATADDIREATLCMIRRNDGYNVQSMSRYLTTCFPKIPPDWQMPIVVAAFTAVQKASAVHGDTLLRDDDERTEWARRSLARWAHGLSAVEPSRCYSDYEEAPSRASSTARCTAAEVIDPLELLQLPVTANSAFARADVEAAFEGTDTVIRSNASEPSNDIVPDVESDGILVEKEVINIKAIMDGWGNIGNDQLCQPVAPSTASSVAERVATSTDVVSVLSTGAGSNEVCDASVSEVIKQATPSVSMPAEKSMPLTFSDLLAVETDDPVICEELTRPLSVLITPLSTPKVDAEYRVEAAFDIHASPHPSLDGDPTTDSEPLQCRDSTTNSRVSSMKHNSKELPYISAKAKKKSQPVVASTKTKVVDSHRSKAGAPVGSVEHNSTEKDAEPKLKRAPLRTLQTSENGREVSATSSSPPSNTGIKRKSHHDDEHTKRRSHDRVNPSSRSHTGKCIMRSPPEIQRKGRIPDLDHRRRHHLPPPPPPKFYDRFADGNPPRAMPRWTWY